MTISNFTPKPHTPFQWHSVSTSEFVRKQEMLRREFRGMKGVKANFTDVRLSAMEDFIGRGDRRLGAVLRRAWELGAGMDAWFDSVDRAYAAWGQAITEAGLAWKYRQVENGEWNVFAQDEQGLAHPSLDAPLPWDHINTGIDKQWLKEDLQKALAAATVPDCSFDGCSHCGVCTPDFGHNVVIAPPPIPEFAGEFTPNQQRVQRLRVWFGKTGDMALVSHLDLLRLLDRALRRASLPVAFSGGFHPQPRISIANALPLGSTSSGEIVDFELTQIVEPALFQEKLAAQLPPQVPVYRVEAVDLKGASATQLLQGAEYFIAVALSVGEDPQSSANPILPTQELWQEWITAVKAQEAILREQTTKSGKKKVVNLREQLFELELAQQVSVPLQQKVSLGTGEAVLRYVGSCRNDGTMLRPEHLIYMLEQVAGQEFELLHSHRQGMILEQLEDMLAVMI